MTTQPRLLIVDVARGIAILLMVVYHLCYDLSWFGFADFDFYNDPFWLHARTFILSLFLLLVGIGLGLAHGWQLKLAHALRRVAVIALNAALVSLATWWLFGDRLVFFGVLHFIVVASLVALPFVKRRWLSLSAGICLLVLGSVQNSWFDQTGWQWIGMMTYKPPTEDYVPLVPWLGVVFLGLFLAPWIPVLNRRVAVNAQFSCLLSRIGQRSLLIYMAHQPFLIGTIKLFTAVT